MLVENIDEILIKFSTGDVETYDKVRVEFHSTIRYDHKGKAEPVRYYVVTIPVEEELDGE